MPFKDKPKTHKAVNSRTGKEILVTYNKETGNYNDSFLTQLKKDCWYITPLINPEVEESIHTALQPIYDYIQSIKNQNPKKATKIAKLCLQTNVALKDLDKMSNKDISFKIDLIGDKYTYIRYTDGSQECLRHGEEWRNATDLCGDNMVFALAETIAELECKLRDKTLAPTDNGIPTLDNLCKQFNNKEIDLTELVCDIWNSRKAL